MKKKVQSTSNKDLTKKQKEVLELLTKKNKTIKQISKQRGVSERAIYKTVDQLRKKKLLTRSFTRAKKKFGSLLNMNPEPFKGTIRLHGEMIKARIIWKSPIYDRRRTSHNIIIHEAHTVMLFRESVIINCNEFQFFYGDTASIATAKCIKFYENFILGLEDKLNIKIIGHNKMRLKLCKSHYARYDREVGKYVEKEGKRVKIYATEDGKLWFEIDKSWNLDEVETLHPDTAQDDMEEVEKQLNDWRDNKPPTNSELMKIAKVAMHINKETAAGLNTVVTYIESQIPKKKDDPSQKDLNYFG